MGFMMCKEAYEKIIKEDIEWLKKQENTLEAQHIEAVLNASIKLIYGE